MTKTVNRFQNLTVLFLLVAFRFFASLQLAIFLLIALMVVLAAGTFIESLHGTDAARLVIYQSSWFSLLLVLLAINLAAAALDRYPWKKKHTGFVITHLGIIMILMGSFLTQQQMVDGQMVIPEGESESRLTLTDPLLYAFSPHDEKDWLFELKPKAFAWSGRKAMLEKNSEKSDSFQLELIQMLPKARMKESLIASEIGSAAAEITIKNSFVNEKLMLIQDDPDFGRRRLGPATFSFLSQALKEEAADPKGDYLEFLFKDKTIYVPIFEQPKPPIEARLEGTPYHIEILETFQNARVEEMKLVEDPVSTPGEKNPAVRFKLKGGGLEELHTAFANFPDFPTLHGMQPSQTGAKIFYRMAGMKGSKKETHELRLTLQNEELYYQIQKGRQIKTEKAVLGQDIPLGWMDLHFKIETFYPHAALEKQFTPEPNTATGENIFPAIQLELEKQREKKLFWLGQGLKEEINLKNGSFQFLYGEKRVPAGFRLELKDFKIDYYPGTNNPASYESDVILKDDARGVVKKTTISMNAPLEYRGYKIYQSGYSLAEGQPETSIFAVGKDPGIPAKYLGTIVMVVGIVMMFYTRRFSSGSGRIV